MPVFSNSGPGWETIDREWERRQAEKAQHCPPKTQFDDGKDDDEEPPNQ